MKVLVFIFTVGLLIPHLLRAETNSDTLSLRDCIQIALENNVEVNTARNFSRMADLGVNRSYSNILPKVDASATAWHIKFGPSTRIQDTPVGRDEATGEIIYEQRNVTTPSRNRNSYSADISVSQNIYDGGFWCNNIKQKKTQNKAAQFDMKSTQNQVIKLVGQYYFDLLKQMKLLEVDSLAVQRSLAQLDRAQSMYEIGSVAQVDVFRARVNLGQDSIALLNQQNTVRRSKQSLNIAMGRDPHQELRIDPSAKFDYAIADLPNYLETAYNQHPELRSREMEVRSSELGVSIAKSSFLPNLGASFSYSRDNEIFDKIYTDLDKNWTINYGVRLSYNLFNGFADRVNYQTSKIELKNSKLSLSDYKRRLKSTITNLYNDYQAILEIVDINEKNLQAAREEYRLASERYRLGSGTSLELREAQVNLNQAEQVLVSAEYNAIITYLELQESIGTIQNTLKL